MTEEIFHETDTDNSGFVDIEELSFALANHPDLDEEQSEYLLTHAAGVFKIADMKKFSAENVNDDKMSLEEFQNIMHSCLYGEPKIYWAYAFVTEAANSWDGMHVSDCAIADYINENWGIPRKDILIPILELEA